MEDYEVSDLFGSDGSQPNAQYSLDEHNTPVDMSGYDYYGGNYSFGDQPMMPEQQPQFDFNSNISNVAPPEWNQMPQMQLSGAEQQAAGMMPSSTNWNTNWDTNGIQNTLANLFNNKAFVSGIGALMEGSQNKKKAAMTQQMVRQMQPAMDPFGAQRAQYQQELARTMQDPYSAPIVRDQVEQLKRAQAIKDAAAGRRSNSATTDPALMAAMAGVAQKYMDSLYTPAGANINPSGLSSLISAMQQGNNADVNGYISPIMSALGYTTGINTNSAQMNKSQPNTSNIPPELAEKLKAWYEGQK